MMLADTGRFLGGRMSSYLVSNLHTTFPQAFMEYVIFEVKISGTGNLHEWDTYYPW